jgi:hypothetical protein
MEHKIKLWVGLGLGLGLATSLATGNMVQASGTPHANHGKILLADASGEGGEGGGEGGGDATAKGSDDTAFLVSLSLMEGHMRVGTELYGRGEAEMAKTHMKHPRDEIYTALEPALKARKAPDFAAALDAVGQAVNAGGSAEEVKKLYDVFADALHLARPPSLEASTAANAAVQLVRTAAEEYAVGVKDGKIDNIHEYQDAWGFTQVAAQILATLSEAERTEHQKEIEGLEAEIAGLAALWPDLAGKALFVAAANMELLALDIK